jgi:hypothetical protein
MMRFPVRLTLAIAMVAGGPAFALLDDTPNALGVYFDDETFTQNSCYPEPFVPFHVYFVLSRPSCPLPIAGFEFAWRFEPTGSLTIVGFELPPNALNIGTEYNLHVGLGTPLPVSSQYVLLEVMIVSQEAVPCTYIAVGPATPASIPLHMLYAPEWGCVDLIPMTLPAYGGVMIDPNGWSVPGVATIGCPGPVANEAQSWSTIKALYQ